MTLSCYEVHTHDDELANPNFPYHWNMTSTLWTRNYALLGPLRIYVLLHDAVSRIAYFNNE